MLPVKSWHIYICGYASHDTFKEVADLLTLIHVERKKFASNNGPSGILKPRC